ncbi:MAG: hypothetical protein ABJC74_14735 [Gemmatimonadota bacterium]
MIRISSTWRLLGLVALAGCAPGSTRPPFNPSPASPSIELELVRIDAIGKVADALKADSIPLERVEIRDAWLETPWFNQATNRPEGNRAAGYNAVRIRAWAEPGRALHSEVIIEAVYKPAADPSVPGRSLERLLPDSHPMAARLAAIVKELVKTYGDPTAADSTTPGLPSRAAKP